MVRVFTNHQSKHGSWGHEPWLNLWDIQASQLT